MTVLLPVRDGAAFLPMACDSILAQTFEDFELLAIDDGSTDATPDILADYARSDRRVSVIRQSGDGLVAALNRGLAEARSPYVARMDADDMARPDRLSLQTACLDANPGTALAGSAWTVIDAGGAALRQVMPPLTPVAIRTALRDRNCIAHPSVMMRRSAVLALGGYRPGFVLAEDYDLWLRLAEAHDLVNLPDPLLFYREHRGQSSRSGLEQAILSEMGAIAAAERRRLHQDDGVSGTSAIDRGTLRALGLTDQRITAGIVSRALGAAKNAARTGDPVAVRAASRLVLRQRRLRLRTAVHCILLFVRSLRPRRSM